MSMSLETARKVAAKRGYYIVTRPDDVFLLYRAQGQQNRGVFVGKRTGEANIIRLVVKTCGEHKS